MAITRMTPSTTGTLTDSVPSGTERVVKQTVGTDKTYTELTKRSYDEMQLWLDSAKTKSEATTPRDAKGLKLGYIIEKAALNRGIATRMCDLTETYAAQMNNLIAKNQELTERLGDEYNIENEGRREGTKDLITRFDKAIGAGKDVYDKLQTMRQTALDAVAEKFKVSLNQLPHARRMSSATTLMKQMAKRYQLQLKYGHDTFGQFQVQLTPIDKDKSIFDALVRGKNTFAARYNSVKYLKTVTNKQNKATWLPTEARTKGKTLIEMLYYVHPKHNTSTFSDHAGFVCKFSAAGKKPYVIYYQSLEHHGHHTETRIRSSYAKFTKADMLIDPTRLRRTPNNTNLTRLYKRIFNPRDEFVGKCLLVLKDMIEDNRGLNGAFIVIVGECTASVHTALTKAIADRMTNPWLDGYECRTLNASGYNPVGKDDGRHALMAYCVEKTAYNTLNQRTGVYCSAEIQPCTVTDNLNTFTQNMFGVTFNNENFAFAHLLNGKEDDIAKQLEKDNISAVGGDLNNISTPGSWFPIAATMNRAKTRFSGTSNSAHTELFDKIVVLDP